jgi:hypothetical protein
LVPRRKPRSGMPSTLRRQILLDHRSATQGVNACQTPDGAITSLTFTLGCVKTGEYLHYFKHYDSILTSPVLRGVYMVDYSLGSAYDQKIKFLKQRLQAQTIIELSKLPDVDRPPYYNNIRTTPELLEDRRFLKSFTKPLWWIYYDNDVIEYLNRLEDELGEEGAKSKRYWEE